MAEQSGYYNTSGSPAGDQVTGYDQVKEAWVAAVTAACHGFEGVAPSYLNSLAGTVTAANTVQIGSGGAIVDGVRYKNDAPLSVNIPSAVGSGNTRIDRIVLRVNWASYTCRITRIAGVDAASPSVPAIMQNPGSTYDLKLYQALVNTSGTVTLTDERTMAQVQAAGIASQAVTTAKIANGAVNQPLLGAGTLIPTKRQGNATDPSWGTFWGTTNYALSGANIRVQMGVGQPGTVVTFPEAFSQIPLIFVSFQGISTNKVALVLDATNVHADRFLAHAYQFDGTEYKDGSLAWLAIGPG